MCHFLHDNNRKNQTMSWFGSPQLLKQDSMYRVIIVFQFSFSLVFCFSLKPSRATRFVQCRLLVQLEYQFTFFHWNSHNHWKIFSSLENSAAFLKPKFRAYICQPASAKKVYSCIKLFISQYSKNLRERQKLSWV